MGSVNLLFKIYKKQFRFFAVKPACMFLLLSFFVLQVCAAAVVMEKPPEGQGAQEALSETKIEELMEEHLAQISETASAPAPAPVKAETGNDSGNPALEEKRLRAAQMLVDSGFYNFFEKDSNTLSPQSIQKLAASAAAGPQWKWLVNVQVSPCVSVANEKTSLRMSA